MNDYVNTAIALLTGGIPGDPTPHYGPGPSPLNAKVIELRQRGHSVVQTGMGVAPSQWRVDGGPELTNDQLLAL